MMKASRLIVVGAAVLLPVSAVFAQSAGPTPADPPAPKSGTTFESLDANSDGRISKEEAKVNANVTAQFASYDVNGDGFIEKAEVQQASQPKAETPPQ
jgi:hypothetical protein